MKIIVALGLLIAGAAGWFFLSPLFINEEVNESFDFVQSDGRLDMEALADASPDMRESMRDDIMEAAAAAPVATAAEAMPVGVPSVLASGQFIDADAIHQGSGRATVYQLPDGERLVRFEDFRATNGPDLAVYLVKHPGPTSAADVTGSGFVSLGKLKGNVGNQNYPLPADVDLSEFGSVVIWCELFGVLFSPAALVPAL